MGCSSRSIFLTTFLVGVLVSIALLFEGSGATRSRKRGTTDAPRGGSVNEAAVFAHRGRQEGSRRARTTTTTVAAVTTSTAVATSSATTSLVTLVPDYAVQPAALLAPDDEPWPTRQSSTTDIPVSYSSTTTPEPPIQIVVKPHSEVVLPCKLKGNDSMLLLSSTRNYRLRPATWWHAGSPVDMITIDTRMEISGTGHRYVGDSTTAALHIDNVRHEDDGTWNCTLEDESGTRLISRPVRLVVLEAPKAAYLLIDGRRLDPGNQFVPVKEDSNLTVECAAEGGRPPPVFSWGMTLSQATLDGPEQLPDNLTILPSTQGSRSGAHLKVLRGHHNATIICIARHDTLETPLNTSILLDVQYIPSFAITRIPGFGNALRVGMSVSLKCEVDSNPPSAPIWQRDELPLPVEQSDDGWLNFTKITFAEIGWYKCSTRHLLGAFTSAGYFLNVRNELDMETEAEPLNGKATGSRKKEVQIGGVVTLECDRGCWGRGPGMDPVGGPGPLALSRVVYQDAGQYRCVAPDRKMQETWRAQLPFHVKVTGRPMVNPVSQTVTANEGESLDVMVEFCAEPSYTRVLWLSERRVYLPGVTSDDGVQVLEIENSETVACYKTVLHFDAVQWSHAGEWLLLVRSPEGIADASVLVNVTRASGYSHAHFRSLNLPGLLLCLALSVLHHRYQLQRHRRRRYF